MPFQYFTSDARMWRPVASANSWLRTRRLELRCAKARVLEAAGWEARPSWPARDSDLGDPSDVQKGWQRPAASALNVQHTEREVMPDLEQTSQHVACPTQGCSGSPSTCRLLYAVA